MEEDAAVNALISALFLFSWPSVHQSQSPPLELVRILPSQGRRVLDAHGLTDDVIRFLDRGSISTVQTALYQGDSQVGDVNADPLAV